MIHAYHFILSAYGFWLPNDPRGSWSDFVGAWELFRYGGPATKVTTTKSVAHVPHDRAQRLEIKKHLKYPPVTFTGKQALAISAGFARASREGNYLIHACAILPEHCHLVIGRHQRPIGQIAGHLKTYATRELRRQSLWDIEDHEHSPWGRNYWAVFIDELRWVDAAIKYVQRNPEKEGKRNQRWSFVTPHNPR
jgi:REP element-mobilizing transposase RayT